MQCKTTEEVRARIVAEIVDQCDETAAQHDEWYLLSPLPPASRHGPLPARAHAGQGGTCLPARGTSLREQRRSESEGTHGRTPH